MPAIVANFRGAKMVESLGRPEVLFAANGAKLVAPLGVLFFLLHL